ncbi:MAG: hypothetical protein KJO23_03595 [Bacteroidia bacterium]|nr:hypothetical protein [Bacteroidia bacterium]
MSLKNSIFVTVAFLSIQSALAQPTDFLEYNYIGLTGGLGISDIQTDNFVTDSGTGYYFGFTTRGAFYNSFDLIYGISFVQNQVGILGNNLSDPNNSFDSQFIDYTMQAAQINLLGSLNIVRDHLSIEAGPILNVNGKMKLNDDGFGSFTLEGYETLKAEDIQNVSRVHFMVAGGITAGITNFRLGAMYQYGVTNLFNRFNENGEVNQESGSFEGHTSNILLMATIYL